VEGKKKQKKRGRSKRQKSRDKEDKILKVLTTVAKLFPDRPGVKCYELYLVHLAVVPFDYVVRMGRDLVPVVQAYLASVSFVDAPIGRLLDAAERRASKRDFIIVLWSDHGWNLGQKEHWHKVALWENTTHVPLIMSVPGITEPGSRCERPVDLLESMWCSPERLCLTSPIATTPRWIGW
jgi:membrane-anchored protein YejM (alkaline phosphatase superfamily)